MLQIPESLTKDTVLKYLDELTIFEYYLGHKAQLKDMYLSPFREEKRPSFNLYINRFNGRLWFKDHASHSGDCFRLVQLLYNNCSFMEALKIVNRDFNLGIGDSNISSSRIIPVKQIIQPKEFKLEIKVQEYTDVDIEYWNTLLELKNIKEYLRYFRVLSSAKLWIDEFHISEWDYTDENPVYAYYDNKRFKMYRPNELDKANKWKSNLEYEQWLGYNQLPAKGEKLIISKGYKDVLLLRRLGLPAIAVNGESHTFPSQLVNELKWRFDKLIIWYDNDETGLKYAEQKSEEYGIEYVVIPEGEAKDISDFKLENGMDETENLLAELCLI